MTGIKMGPPGPGTSALTRSADRAARRVGRHGLCPGTEKSYSLQRLPTNALPFLVQVDGLGLDAKPFKMNACAELPVDMGVKQ